MKEHGGLLRCTIAETKIPRSWESELKCQYLAGDLFSEKRKRKIPCADCHPDFLPVHGFCTFILKCEK